MMKIAEYDRPNTVAGLVAKHAELTALREQYRAEIGIHHRIAGEYLDSYAVEMAWREDCRREANGNQYAMIVSAVSVAPKSERLCGYWQRRRA